MEKEGEGMRRKEKEEEGRKRKEKEGEGWRRKNKYEHYYFVGSTGLLNKYLHTISCSQDVGVIWDFILTKSHLVLTAPGP